MKRLILTLSILLFTASPVFADLTVFAASSLREALIEIGEIYKERAGQKVNLNFAGSQTLRTQIEFGAPADLYAAANPEIIKPLVNKNLVGPVHYFAGNNLVLLLSKRQSPIKQLNDLTRREVQIAIGNNYVPIGKYTRQLLAGMKQDPAFGEELIDRIWQNVRTEESNVKAIVTKALLDEVDAGIVYRTDLIADVRAKTSHLELPEAHNPFVRYPAAVVRSSRHPEAAQIFLDLMLAPDGQRILQSHGFLPTEPGGYE